ncbi:MAG TPA: EI24 domain-containing protein [Vicinamibacteria bacterium]|nr:EI24 domain-containing protein [Vicinamibacteria bacterium]
MGATSAALRLPGNLRRAAAGAWHVPGGFLFLVRKPRLLPLAAVPALLAVFCLAGGLAAGLYAGPTVEAALTPAPGRASSVVVALLAASAWLATLTAALALGLASALLLAAPVLDQLSKETERVATGASSDAGRGLSWEVRESLRSALYFLAAAPLVLVVGMVPIVGPPLGALWAARALSFQLTEPSLARRGLGFGERRAWHRAWRPESVGFGLLALAVLIVPCANFALVPALIVGATRLVVELTGGPAAAGPQAQPAAGPRSP